MPCMIRETLFGMRDDTRRNLAFWGVAGLAVGLFVWVYSHAASGEGGFADSPPPLAPYAATLAPSPSPIADMQAPTPSPASPSLSPVPIVILPPTLGREIAGEPPLANRRSVYIPSRWFVPYPQHIEP